MHIFDWAIVCIVVAGLAAGACATRTYVKSAASFLAANRSAGRYLLTMAEGMASFGAVTVLAEFQRFYTAGFAAVWWGLATWPIFMVISMSGWIVYRYRQTKALTMAQFFEMRYSRKFRICAGILAVTAGVINYGIFPAIEAKFFIYFCSIPQYFASIGGFEINLTMGAIMAIILLTALTFTLFGGQISVLVTDFLQGQFVNIVFLLIMVVLIIQFNWSDIVGVLKTVEPGKSLANPFDQKNIANFALPFFLMNAAFNIYCYMAWQGTQGCYCSAKNAHEARMSRIVSTWRAGVIWVVVPLIPVCAYVLLNSNLMPDKAGLVNAGLAGLELSTQDQIRVPLMLKAILPTGILGLFCATMVAASIATHQACLMSGYSIFMQDVVMPLRRSADHFSPEKHIKYLRLSIVGVAAFVWIFSMVFPMRDYILMFLYSTGAIFLGGAGAIIVGGLYWRRGTTAGAWASMSTGAILSICGVLIKNVLWSPLVPLLKEKFSDIEWMRRLPAEFPLDGVQMSFGTAIIAILAYIIVSLCTKVRPGFDLDEMLHREKTRVDTGEGKAFWKNKTFSELLGITPEFTFWDKFIYFSFIGWSITFFIVFLVGTTIAIFWKTTDTGWSKYWLIHFGFLAVIGVVSTAWFLVGGFRDMFDLFRSLKASNVDSGDDGTVSSDNLNPAYSKPKAVTVQSE